MLLLAAAPAFAGTIAGVTRAALTGEPIAGAGIEARSVAHEFTATSDSNGRFLLIGLPPGRYIVVGRKEGWISSRRTQRPVWVSNAGARREAALDFVAPASLRGRVIEENRTPVKCITVTIEFAHGFGGINQAGGAGRLFLSCIARNGGVIASQLASGWLYQIRPELPLLMATAPMAETIALLPARWPPESSRGTPGAGALSFCLVTHVFPTSRTSPESGRPFTARCSPPIDSPSLLRTS